MERLTSVLEAIDAVNAQDSRLDGGKPLELIYGRRMSQWLQKLAPDAGELLRIAVRAQHIARWKLPRANFPMDRPGYFLWRTTLGRMHGDEAARLMAENGYAPIECDYVKSLLRKEKLKSNAETQTLEDCACLVFLENGFAEFARSHDEEKIIDILRKTWGKMSEAAHQQALQLKLAPDAAALVGKALSS